MDRLGVGKARIHYFLRSKRLRGHQLSSGQWVVEPGELARFARIPRPIGKPRKILRKSR